MTKWFVFLVTVLSLNTSFAWNDLPQPLPEEPGTQLPQPPPQQPNQPPQPPPTGEQVRYSLGSADLTRFKEREFTFYPQAGLNRLARLSLTCGRNNIEIKEVRIQYADYFDERLDYVLPGDLDSGHTRTTGLDGRPIYKITVKAHAKYFWKKPGNFRVDVAAYK
ncbi:hypothetical protein [Bdellovibrio sp. NC01]|uniref:hypothetical protein n=1 Tax=Bdellovibrio sp. NC01 TaxID=2220073 RepID=UPI001158CEE2|nr:hypothetical protein [Bdellovibrio sp. NC01]QDK37115.1 hypothetical protein DOE51_05670 [Bdellovibrio sp. NC01]